MRARVTIKDVAAKAQVSFQTVSKVLNDQMQVSPETEQRIRDAVRALGYTPNHRARNLRTQRSYLIGYSWRPEPPNQLNPIHELFLQSMMAAAEKADYHLLPFPYPGDNAHVPAYRKLIQTGRVDGFVLSGIEARDERIEFLQSEQVPFVAFGRSDASANYPYVEVDGAEGLRLATRHLIEQGHKRIAAVAWPPESRVGQDRLQGYQRALRESGLKPNPKWIARGHGTAQFGYEATRRWLTLAPGIGPTGVVALNDAAAIGAMRAIQDFGLRVGADVGVTGFDDSPLTEYLNPSLTTLRQPIWQVGEQVMAILVGLLQGTLPPETQIVLSPRLIVRQSSIRSQT